MGKTKVINNSFDENNSVKIRDIELEFVDEIK